MKSRNERLKKRELEIKLKENEGEQDDQLDLDEQQNKLNTLAQLLSNADLYEEQSMNQIKSKESIPKEKSSEELSFNDNDEETYSLRKLEMNKNNVELQPFNGISTNQVQRKVSFQEPTKENTNQSNPQQSRAIHISKNEIISEKDLQKIESLSQKQIASQQQLSKTYLEEDQQQIQERSDKLKLLLSQPSELRSDLTCKRIAQQMKKVKFLQKYQDMPEFLDICKNLYIKQYDKKQFVFKQGEYGDAFYIILNGSVTIYIDEPTEFKSFMQLKEVAKLEQGDAFGEIALIYDSLRTATVIANEKSLLIVLEKQIFQAYIKELKNQHLTKQIDFLKSIDFFKHLKQSTIIELTTKLQTREYTSNEIIAHEGESLSQITFIKCGRVKVYRSIHFRVNKYSGQKLKGDIKDPTPDELARGAFVTELIEIDEQSDFAVIGDYSLLYEKPLDYTIITIIPTEAYFISSYDIIKIIPQEFLDKHRKNLKKYPNNMEIRQMYWEKREWESFSQKVINNILIEKENKKGFERSLKKPTLKFNNVHIPINLMDIQASDKTVYLDFLSARVPRGLQTKRNINGLKPIQQSISQQTSSTALNLWEKLKEIDGIEPPQSPEKTDKRSPSQDNKHKNVFNSVRSSLPNLKPNVQQFNKSQFTQNNTPLSSRYSKNN